MNITHRKPQNNMKKLSEHIEAVAKMVDDMVRLKERAYTAMNNSECPPDSVWHRLDARLHDQIEALAICLGFEGTQWPGLAPLFIVEGYQLSFQDALAMTFGQPTFAILKQREAEGWTTLPRGDGVTRMWRVG